MDDNYLLFSTARRFLTLWNWTFILKSSSQLFGIPINQRITLVGGIPTPLKNMKVSWDDDIANIWKSKSHVPNHQSDYNIIHSKSITPRYTKVNRKHQMPTSCSAVACRANEAPRASRMKLVDLETCFFQTLLAASWEVPYYFYVPMIFLWLPYYVPIFSLLFMSLSCSYYVDPYSFTISTLFFHNMAPLFL